MDKLSFQPISEGSNQDCTKQNQVSDTKKFGKGDVVTPEANNQKNNGVKDEKYSTNKFQSIINGIYSIQSLYSFLIKVSPLTLIIDILTYRIHYNTKINHELLKPGTIIACFLIVSILIGFIALLRSGK